jgi:hypothetical protein
MVKLENTRNNYKSLRLRLSDFGNFCYNTSIDEDINELEECFNRMMEEQHELVLEDDWLYDLILDYIKQFRGKEIIKTTKE